MNKLLIIFAFFLAVPAYAVEYFYFYDAETDTYTYTNQCMDKRICKSIKWSKGEVKHAKGYVFNQAREGRYDGIIRRASEKHGVDFFLIKSVIKAESAFDPNAVSVAGAKGLMQLMPDTAAEVGVKNVFDPEQNIMGGTRYLKKLIRRFKNNRRNAVAGYNAGPAAVNFYNGIPPFDETVNYVKKVGDFYEKYTGKVLW